MAVSSCGAGDDGADDRNSDAAAAAVASVFGAATFVFSEPKDLCRDSIVLARAGKPKPLIVLPTHTWSSFCLGFLNIKNFPLV